MHCSSSHPEFETTYVSLQTSGFVFNIDFQIQTFEKTVAKDLCPSATEKMEKINLQNKF